LTDEATKGTEVLRGRKKSGRVDTPSHKEHQGSRRRKKEWKGLKHEVTKGTEVLRGKKKSGRVDTRSYKEHQGSRRRKKEWWVLTHEATKGTKVHEEEFSVTSGNSKLQIESWCE